MRRLPWGGIMGAGLHLLQCPGSHLADSKILVTEEGPQTWQREFLALLRGPTQSACGTEPFGSERFELVWSQSRLPEDAAEGPDSQLSVTGHDGCTHSIRVRPRELDVAPALPRFLESGRKQLPSHFPKRKRPKRHGYPPGPS